MQRTHGHLRSYADQYFIALHQNIMFYFKRLHHLKYHMTHVICLYQPSALHFASRFTFLVQSLRSHPPCHRQRPDNLNKFLIEFQTDIYIFMLRAEHQMAYGHSREKSGAITFSGLNTTK